MTNSAKRTKKCIDDAFIRVLESTPFGEISVNDIIEEADISKSTFYKYYNGKYDLAEQFFANFKVKAKEKVIKILEEGSFSREKFFQATADAFNNNRVVFDVTLKIKDEYIDLEKNLLKAIQTGISPEKGFAPFEAEYMANNLFWAWGYVLSLNRYITAKDIALIDQKVDLVKTFNAMVASPISGSHSKAKKI